MTGTVERVDAVVVGAGVVGLACARALAMAGKTVVILERNGEFGSEASSRNSEVIHAGIYYPARSLKARLCVQGKNALYALCERYSVNYRRCGKMIVATSATQEGRLEEILERARDNGVEDLALLSGRQARAMAPGLRCTAALLSPSTGIVDSHELMLALLGDAERHAAILALRSPLESAEAGPDGIRIVVGGAADTVLIADMLVNAAGLSAVGVAARILHFPQGMIPSAFFAKGSYFALTGRAPFTRLIYPVPEPGGLGVHLTLDLGGRARFGPDVEWVDQIEYSVSVQRAERFYEAIRAYWPALIDGALQPAYAGIRAKIAGPGSRDADFLIQGPATHGVEGLVNLFGIESPGLTSCLAIATEVCRTLGVNEGARVG